MGAPFLYFPLRDHFEQNFHIRHRLAMDFGTATPDVIATAVLEELERPARSKPVETDGAQRAAGILAELVG